MNLVLLESYKQNEYHPFSHTIVPYSSPKYAEDNFSFTEIVF
jgi:hypothetical protein